MEQACLDSIEKNTFFDKDLGRTQRKGDTALVDVKNNLLKSAHPKSKVPKKDIK